MMRHATVVGCSVLIAALLALPGIASAASPATPFQPTRIDSPEPQTGGRWAERAATARDITGDGVNDLFIGVPARTLGPHTRAGRVYLISGRTGGVVYSISSPEPQTSAQFGFFISVLGDVDNDAKDDIAIGTDAQDVGMNTDQGKAWVFSGEDGSLIRALDNPDPQPSARFGSRIGRAGDVTGDTVPDIIIGASNNDVPAGCAPGPGCFVNEGQAYIFNGATGALVRTLSLPVADRTNPVSCSSNCGTLGIAVQGPGDTNGDGVPDQLVDAGNYAGQGRMYLFDGATGNVRLRIDSPQPENGATFGFQDAEPLAPGDVNNDGHADLYANGFQQDGPTGEGQGRAWVFNGLTGALLYAIDDPVPTTGGQFGWSLARTDYNKDGRPDLYIGQSPHHVAGQDENGGTYIFDGRDGSLLKALEMPAADRENGTPAGPRLGWGLAAPGDLNGDGEPDYVGGAPFSDHGTTVDQGRLYFFLSQPIPQSPPPVDPPGPGPGPPPPEPPLLVVTPGSGGPVTAKATAKTEVARSRIRRAPPRLDVLAPISRLASGNVRVELFAAGRRTRFNQRIDSANGRVRFSRAISRAQANLGTGILTLAYPGDADTRPQEVRLRAASRRALLDLERPRIVDGRLRANGTVSRLARGVVRVQLEYVVDGNTNTLELTAPIRNGRWQLNEALSQTVLDGIARRQGTVHSYTLFTGYFPRRIRGEMESFQVLGDR